MARVAQLRKRFTIAQQETPVDVNCTLVAHVGCTDPYCTRKISGPRQDNSQSAYRANPEKGE